MRNGKLAGRVLSLLLLSSLSVGCTRLDVKDEQKLRVSQADLDAAAYMGMPLLKRDEQQKLLLKLGEKYRNSQPGDAGGHALRSGIGMAGATVISGSPFTMQGVHTATHISMGLAAAGWVADGIFEMLTNAPFMGKAYLPGQVAGQDISTADQAKKVAVDEADRLIHEAARVINRDIRCVYGCTADDRRIFALRKHGADDLYATFNFGPMQKSTPDAFRDHILGFAPAWESKSSRGWTFFIEDYLPVDDSGKATGEPIRLFHLAYGDPDARKVLRAISSGRDMAMVFGYRASTSLIGFNGRLFRIDLPRADRFIDYEIAPD